MGGRGQLCEQVSGGEVSHPHSLLIATKCSVNWQCTEEYSTLCSTFHSVYLHICELYTAALCVGLFGREGREFGEREGLLVYQSLGQVD